MRLMLLQPEGDDYVLATGKSHSVRELCELAFSRLGLDYTDHVVSEAADLRPAETVQLVGNPSKARARLRWQPEVDFPELVHMMVDADLFALSGDCK